MSNVYTGKPGEQWVVTSTDTGSKLTDKELMELAKNYIQQSQHLPRAYKEPTKDYSLAQVQLTDGSIVGMTITASPSLGSHLTKEMASTGFLYIFNESESLMIKADRVVAIKLTKLTQE